MLYPAELQAHGPAGHGAGDGNRTHTTSLEGWGSTTELHPRDEAAHGPAALLIIAYSTALVKRFFRFFRDSDDAVGLIDVIVIRPHRPVFQLGGNRGGKPALLLDEQQAVLQLVGREAQLDDLGAGLYLAGHNPHDIVEQIGVEIGAGAVKIVGLSRGAGVDALVFFVWRISRLVRLK